MDNEHNISQMEILEQNMKQFSRQLSEKILDNDSTNTNYQHSLSMIV